MKAKLYIVILVSILFFADTDTFAQIIHRTGAPTGIGKDYKSIDYFELSVLESEKDGIRNRMYQKGPSLSFAVGRNVCLSPSNSGYIKQINKSESIWYLSIKSKDAASLNIIFSSFALKSGESVFIYDPEMKVVLGPLTEANNKSSGILAVEPIAGSKIVVEYHFNPADQGSIEIGKISHDVLGIFGNNSVKDGYFNSSGPCNIDINCTEGSEWQKEKRSVVRILAGGTQLGTAFLLNNSNQENIAYTLTALHVVEDESAAASSVVIFKYESPWCDGPDASISYSISGADLISQNNEMDFSLLRLSEFPPLLYKPYLAGWNASSTFATSSVSIHHPSGDVKKISIDNNPPQIDSFKQYQTDGFWRILEWDAGTTEGGSSGAPLFNQDHYVIGYLSGGEAICGRSVNDYFARFDLAYDISSDIFKSLRPWLDPAVSGCTYLNGRDPYAENFQVSDTIYNGNPEAYNLVEYPTGKNGYSTGINSDSILAYAEKFTIPASREITEVFLYVARSNFEDQGDKVIISLHSDNGGPGDVLYTKAVSLSLIKDDFLLVIDFGEALSLSGDIWVSYTNEYKTRALVESRQFAVYKEDNQAAGSDYVWFKDSSGWRPFSEHPFDPGQISLNIKIVCVGNSVVNPVVNIPAREIDISVYPIPFSSEIFIESEKEIERIEILDINGNIIVQYQNFKSGTITINPPSNLSPGFYLLNVYTGNACYGRKIVKN